MGEMGQMKRDVFFRLMEMAGRVFIHVLHSDAVKLGRRGFIGPEQTEGIVLVLNSGMKFTWDADGIRASLVFGSSTEKCFIPHEEIVSIYSPELRAQLSIGPEEAGVRPRKRRTHRNVIKVDFRKKGPPGLHGPVHS
jgi:hypothetical protein